MRATITSKQLWSEVRTVKEAFAKNNGTPSLKDFASHMAGLTTYPVEGAVDADDRVKYWTDKYTGAQQALDKDIKKFKKSNPSFAATLTILKGLTKLGAGQTRQSKEEKYAELAALAAEWAGPAKEETPTKPEGEQSEGEKPEEGANATDTSANPS